MTKNSTPSLRMLCFFFGICCLCSSINGRSDEDTMKGFFPYGGNTSIDISFAEDPPDLVEFLNSTGGKIECKVKGFPKPTVNWIMSDGSPVGNVRGLRQITSDDTLVFPPFKAEDFRQDVHSVIYRCSASNSVGTLISRNIHVKAAIVHPYDVHVYDTYVIRGNNALVKCHVPHFLSQYITVISWLRNDRYVINNTDFYKDFKYVMLNEGDLLIRDVDTDDHGSTYKCKTSHRLSNFDIISSSSGKMFVTEPQTNILPRFTKEFKEIKTVENNSLTLPCIVQGYPVPKVKWFYKTSAGITMPLTENDIDGTLFFSSVKQFNAGRYVCVANNSLASRTQEVTISVFAPLKVMIKPKKNVVNVGDSAVLSCEIQGSPIVSVYWMKDGQPIDKITGISLSSVHSISIPVVTSHHKGIYQCFVISEETSSHDFALLALGDSPPEFTSTFTEQELHPGSRFSLKCSATGTPLPQISWTLDGMSLDYIPTHQLNDGTAVSFINKTNIQTEDGGIYSCKASNKIGYVFHASRIGIFGSLRARSIVKVISVAGETVHLYCPVFGYPIESISWMKGNIVLPDHHRHQVLRNGTLVLIKVQKTSDVGIYTCLTRQSSNGKAEGKVHLSVLVPPKITPFWFQDDLVREGMRARLQCVISEGDTPLRIQWTKDNKPIPTHLGITIKDLDEFSSILMIPTITPRHNGDYKCTATNDAATTFHTATLSVNVAPKISPFSFQEDSTLEGSFARITCLVYQGDLPITIQWLKDGETIEEYADINTRIVDEYSSILTIEKVQTKHTGNYTCIAKNAAAIVTHTAELKVYVPPKIVPFNFQSEPLLEGMLVRVSCVVSRGDLPLTITWLKDEKEIAKELAVTVKDFDEYSSVLSIDPVTVNHSGNYTCIVSNHAGTVSHTSPLVVYVPPRWIIRPQDQTGIRNSSLIVDCKADGYPLPKITWKQILDINTNNDTDLSMSNKYIYNNGSLHFIKLSTENEGYYNCYASNGIGEKISKTIYIKVQAPVSFIKSHSVHYAKINTSTGLKCSVQGDPPVIIKWFLKSEEIKNTSKYHITFDANNDTTHTGNLEIIQVTLSDKGEYYCVASNKYGNASAIIELVVQNTPSSPGNIAVKFIGNRSVELSWSSPYDGHSPLLMYNVQYKKKQDSWASRSIVINVKADTKKTYIKELQPATIYMFRVAAVNNVGSGNYSDIVEITISEEAPEGAPQQIEVESVDPQTLRISWKPPKKNLWNGVIRGYNVGYKVYNTSMNYNFKNIEVPEDYSESLIYQLSNLKMYTRYSIIIQAYNNGGKGPTSEEIIVMTSEDKPTLPPRNVRCSALSSRSIYVIWQPPLEGGVHGILRGYKVFYKPVNEYHDEPNNFNITNMTKITLMGLNTHANYSIQILAYTKLGEGVLSQPIFCKTHEDVPEAPADIKALPVSDDSVLVSWKPPKRSNGAIFKYNVYYTLLGEKEEVKDFNAKNKTDGVNVMTLEGDFRYYEVKGLQMDNNYAFWVSAVSTIGEGPSSAVVKQFPTNKPIPAQIASFNEIIKTSWKRNLNLHCKSVGFPFPDRQWFFKGSEIKESDVAIIRYDGTLVLKSIDSNNTGNYTCKVINKHGSDEVEYSLTVTVPPESVTLDIMSKTLSSIRLQWRQGNDGGEPINGYILHYRRERGKWNTIEIPKIEDHYSINNLACGATYQLYMEAVNKVGVGMPSETITVSTHGEVFQFPDKEQIIHEGATFATLNFDSWPQGGCPVYKFVVEYQPISGGDWILVSDTIRSTQKKVVISNLEPATWYVLRLSAYTSSDDFNTWEYIFSTRSLAGGTIPPHVLHKEEKVMLFYLDPWIFIPAVGFVILCIVIALILFIYCKKHQTRRNVPRNWSQYTGTISGRSDMGMSVESFLPGPKGSQRPRSYHERDDDSNLYATVRLPDCYPQETMGKRLQNEQMQKFMNTGPKSTSDAIKGHPVSGNNIFPPADAVGIFGENGLQETTFIFDESMKAQNSHGARLRV